MQQQMFFPQSSHTNHQSSPSYDCAGTSVSSFRPTTTTPRQQNQTEKGSSTHSQSFPLSLNSMMEEKPQHFPNLNYGHDPSTSASPLSMVDSNSFNISCQQQQHIQHEDMYHQKTQRYHSNNRYQYFPEQAQESFHMANADTSSNLSRIRSNSHSSDHSNVNTTPSQFKKPMEHGYQACKSQVYHPHNNACNDQAFVDHKKGSSVISMDDKIKKPKKMIKRKYQFKNKDASPSSPVSENSNSIEMKPLENVQYFAITNGRDINISDMYQQQLQYTTFDFYNTDSISIVKVNVSDMKNSFKRSVDSITRDELLRVLHLTQQQASTILGCSVSTIKRRFYGLRNELGFSKWPNNYFEYSHTKLFDNIYPLSLNFILNKKKV